MHVFKYMYAYFYGDLLKRIVHSLKAMKRKRNDDICFNNVVEESFWCCFVNLFI